MVSLESGQGTPGLGLNKFTTKEVKSLVCQIWPENVMCLTCLIFSVYVRGITHSYVFFLPVNQRAGQRCLIHINASESYQVELLELCKYTTTVSIELISQSMTGWLKPRFEVRLYRRCPFGGSFGLSAGTAIKGCLQLSECGYVIAG